MAKKKKIQIEPRTENVRFLTEREVKSFLSMMEERRMAIDFDILDILEQDEILHIEAVIFNGLVDAYMAGKKCRRAKLKPVQGVCILCPEIKQLK
jgi:hypothetical protein